MNFKTKLAGVVILLFLSSSVLADRELSKTEKTQLFQQLTSNPRTTWIKAGTIEAVQEEYRAPKTTNEQQILNSIKSSIEEYQSNDEKAEIAENLQKMALEAIPFNIRYHLSNEYTMKSSTILRYDGKRYYCDINIESRQDSVQVPDELKSNQKTEQFNLNWNGRRIICFDGEKQTTYTPAVNHAIIESANSMPGSSIALLTSGIIPWGSNSLTYEKLSQIKSSAVEKPVNGHPEIHLTLNYSDGTELSFVLDPEKAYSPLSWIVKKTDSTMVHVYSGYKLVSGSWVPASIVIEKFGASTDKLLAGDYINITRISGEVPLSGSFAVDFVPNTLIEYFYDVTKPELVYYSSNSVNTDLLLAERKAYIESEDTQVQNCATSSLQYAALQLGMDILNDRLSRLVNPVDQTTSLQDMKKYAEELGFNCKTVITDIQTLKNLPGCKAILHLPGQKHYVLLDHIDQKYVWLIDLTRDKFYYRIDINFFGMDWAEGTAMLISNQPITLPDGTTEIPDDQLIGYKGGLGWSCTYRLQNFQILHCPYNGEYCFGLYQTIYSRWGCESAESGTCFDDIFIQKKTYPCINDPNTPYTCNALISGLVVYYMWACK